MKQDYPFDVVVTSGEKSITCSISKPTRTTRKALKRAFAAYQAAIGNALRTLPEAVKAFEECNGEFEKLDVVLAELAKKDLTLVIRMAPMNVEIEEAQERYAIEGFQAIIQLAQLSSQELSCIMSPYTSEFWQGVEDLSILSNAIEFFRSHADARPEASSQADRGVADLQTTGVPGEEETQATQVVTEDPV